MATQWKTAFLSGRTTRLLKGFGSRTAGGEIYYVSGDQWLVYWNFGYDGEERHGSWDFDFETREANPNNDEARAIQRQ